MITRIEIDGFKTFRQFKLDLAPLQVIVGLNGVGKSNLFDALRLLSLLADNDLRQAFQALRGEAGELFTALPNGQHLDTIRLAVDMLVERSVQDSWGGRADLKYTRLRYELHILRRADEQGLERLYVIRESLASIRRSEDDWIKAQGLSVKDWLPRVTGGRAPFISTLQETGLPTIYLHQDGRSGRKASVAEKIERTVLSSVINTEFPHAFAARQEMRRWRFLHLDPEALREPSSMLAEPYVTAEGRNLPGALARLQSEDSTLLNDISRDLANLVPGILEVTVEKDQPRNRYILWARIEDQRAFSSRVLSDGTLRLLALVTFKNDPQHNGVLCFEEPENGVHPFRLKNMARLLRALATDFNDLEQVDEPLRQLLVNTHSPILVSQPAIRSSLLFADLVTRVDRALGETPLRVTQIHPVAPAQYQMKLLAQTVSPEQVYTLDQVIQYLNSADLGEALAEFGAALS